MALKVALIALAEFVTCDAANRLVIAGTMDTVHVAPVPGSPAVSPIGPLRLPKLHLVVIFTASIADKSADVAFVVRHEDGDVVVKQDLGPIDFIMNPLGRPLRAQLIVVLDGLTVPGFGDYDVVVMIGDEVLATAPLYVDGPQAP